SAPLLQDPNDRYWKTKVVVG
ncbi:hypothetical protein NPIL_585441, partial [Nephila pilipes]